MGSDFHDEPSRGARYFNYHWHGNHMVLCLNFMWWLHKIFKTLPQTSVWGEWRQWVKLCCFVTSERCHEEIVRVLGYDRSPCMDDRIRLPYIHATVHEILRFGNIVPLGVIHQTTEESQLRGYTIPKVWAVKERPHKWSWIIHDIITTVSAWKYPISALSSGKICYFSYTVLYYISGLLLTFIVLFHVAECSWKTGSFQFSLTL